MKVICDVCGTTFADTATHCPICGCAAVRPAKSVADSQASSESSTAGAYARGGRYSKNNVRRNSRGNEGRFSDNRNRNNDSQQSNKGLVAVVIVLLLAIIMVVVYIGFNVFLKGLGNNDNLGGNNQSNSTPADDNQLPEEIPCTAIQLGRKLQEFTAETDQLLLAVETTPENTTDPITFESSDYEVATVDGNGLVQPGTKQGEAIITVTCGDVVEECKIISTVGEAPEEPEPEIPAVDLPVGFVLKLKTYKDQGEITLSNQYPTAVLYTETMGIKASDITWTSSDPAVAIVENGKAIGLDHGTCTITATIGDQTATCKVICRVDPVEETPYKLNVEDVTLYSDSGSKSFTNLELKEVATGAKKQVEWKVSKEGVVEVSDTGKITACTVTSSTTVNVYTEFEGVTYTCIVRVHPKQTEN